eukprot:CAMPEP_0198519150 /NCGR_PEP_ID=MMETSP1462-20131121/19550_1 /TAXON_ID=1333877 /ORGANISM="Brandtodinium nutriculum, Strain RCC3387" /LENGTH=53 /DNA_ID=CAMNT_0044248753 /DNA_START=45 /DNA_END=203 /DNA_ORIENTATION=-
MPLKQRILTKSRALKRQATPALRVSAQQMRTACARRAGQVLALLRDATASAVP